MVPVQELRIVTRTRERYQAITALHADGASIAAIARTLGWTGTPCAGSSAPPGSTSCRPRPCSGPACSTATPTTCTSAGPRVATDAAALTKEITALGYRGSEQTVRRYLHPLRDGRPTPPARPAAPTVREVTGWILRRPDTLEPGEQVRLKQVLAHCPQLDSAATRVAAFAEMMCGRHGERLDDWLIAVEADDLPELRRFTTGLRRDYDAVLAGLTLEHSSGPVEGTVNKIKMLKRQMFGRANFDLLRKRVLLAH